MIHDLLMFILLSLSVLRISNLLVQEDGPGDIFLRFREWVGIFDIDTEFGEIRTVSENFFAKLFSCIWCTSMWVSFGIALVYLLSPQMALYLSYPLGLSMVAIFLNEIMERE